MKGGETQAGFSLIMKDVANALGTKVDPNASPGTGVIFRPKPKPAVQVIVVSLFFSLPVQRYLSIYIFNALKKSWPR
jgi:hypothetical protein